MTSETRPARVLMHIGGSRTGAVEGGWFAVTEPATGQTLAEVPRGSAGDVAAATSAALDAFPAWRGTAAAVRGRLLTQVADDLETEKEQVATLLSRESGNAIRLQSRPEVQSAIDLLRYFGGTATEAKGETVPLGDGVFNFTTREPVGVVGAMTPWNAPVQLAVVKIAAALATGNTVVIKVSEDAPVAVLAVARIFERYLPPGVLNVVTGLGPEAGAALLAERRIAKLSFTGSTTVGRMVMAAAAEHMIPVSLELGGKSPSIVFPDADDEVTADGVIASMRFPRQGQSCTAGSRLFVHESIYDSFLEKVAKKVEEFVVGDPLDEATDIGSIINQRQFDRVDGYVRTALDQGAVALTGGGRWAGADAGYFYTPTVLSRVDIASAAAREEIFGPVQVAIPWRAEDEVVALANDSDYGLAGYVWSHDIDAAMRTAARIESGWVQVNRGLGQLPGMSCGGTKASGIGREFSLEGALEAFTYRKTTTVAIRG
jgi:betaine-aldehyde dehydrogenase